MVVRLEIRRRASVTSRVANRREAVWYDTQGGAGLSAEEESFRFVVDLCYLSCLRGAIDARQPEDNSAQDSDALTVGCLHFHLHGGEVGVAQAKAADEL